MLLYPTRFDSANAHRNRVQVLRGLAEYTKENLASEVPFRYVRFERRDKRSLYVVDFGHGEVALDKWQVELIVLGFTAALAVTQTSPHKKIRELLGQVARPFETGQEPRPWAA